MCAINITPQKCDVDEIEFVRRCGTYAAQQTPGVTKNTKPNALQAAKMMTE